jgi:CubicO group peptidase (beta-lactamase class C family)
VSRPASDEPRVSRRCDERAARRGALAAACVCWCLSAAVWPAACGGGEPAAPSAVTGLDAAFAGARAEANLKSLVVARGGTVLRAEYPHGGSPETPEYIWSVTKSVLALAVGVALDEGCLPSLDQTIGDLLGPSLVTDPAKAGITLRHLLTMSSGIDFPEASFYATGPSLYNAWVQSPDQVAFVMARAMTAQPGQRFEYGSGTIHLASVALARACRSTTSSFAHARIFAPLGIGARTWEADRQGYSNGGAGLSLTPNDMQAIGTVVLDAGRYRGLQVVSAGWVEAMTRSQIATPSGSALPFYGYGWWVGRTQAGDALYLANGWGGQFIFVVPAKGLVVTTAASTATVSGEAAMAQWQRIFQVVYSQVLPSF